MTVLNKIGWERRTGEDKILPQAATLSRGKEMISDSKGI